MDLWIPGATKYTDGAHYGGSMLGTACKALWHTTENDYTTTTALDIAKYLIGKHYEVHAVWNPYTGEIVCLLPANLAGRGLSNAAGGVETNRDGKICYQIEVVAYAAHPWTDLGSQIKGLDTIMTFLDQLGIPRTAPAGDLLPYPQSYGKNGVRHHEDWAKSGHFGHENVPENDHGDPGALSWDTIFGALTVAQISDILDALTDIKTAIKSLPDDIWQHELKLSKAAQEIGGYTQDSASAGGFVIGGDAHGREAVASNKALTETLAAVQTSLTALNNQLSAEK